MILLSYTHREASHRSTHVHGSREKSRESKGAQGTVAKATGRSAPAQGSNPGCRTCSSGASLGVFLSKKKKKKNRRRIDRARVADDWHSFASETVLAGV